MTKSPEQMQKEYEARKIKYDIIDDQMSTAIKNGDTTKMKTLLNDLLTVYETR